MRKTVNLLEAVAQRDHAWFVKLRGSWKMRQKFRTIGGVWDPKAKEWKFTVNPTAMLVVFDLEISQAERLYKRSLQRKPSCLHCSDPVTVVIRPCGHKCACLRHAVATSQCILCKADMECVESLDPNDSLVTEFARAFPVSKLLYDMLVGVVSKTDYAGGKTTAVRLHTIRLDSRSYLSVDQTEELLRSASAHGNTHFTVEKMLVRFCNEPWKVDRELGSAGVCYHGNMGIRPSSIRHGMAILKDNATDPKPE